MEPTPPSPPTHSPPTTSPPPVKSNGEGLREKIEEKPDKEVQMEVMVAVGEGMENGDVRGIKMVTKEVDEEIWTIAMRI